MSAGAVIAGQVAIEAQVQNVNEASQNLNRLNRDMAKLEKTTGGLQSAMKGFRGLIAALVALNVIQRNIGKINKVIRETVDQIDNLDKGSKRLGLTVKEYRNFALAAQMAGSSIEQFETAFTSMQRNIANLALTEAGGEAKGAFEILKLDMKELLDMDPAERLYRIAGALQEFGKHGDRSGLAMKIFGESGAKLLPLLDQGEEGLRKFVGGIESLTGDISPDAISKFAEMRDAMALWDSAMLTAQANLSAHFIPAIIDVLAALVASRPLVEQLAEQFERLAGGAGGAGASFGFIDVIIGEIAGGLGIVTMLMNQWEQSVLYIQRGMVELGQTIAETQAKFWESVPDAAGAGVLDFDTPAEEAKAAAMQMKAQAAGINSRLKELKKEASTLGANIEMGFWRGKMQAEKFKSTVENTKDVISEMRKLLEDGLLGGKDPTAPIKKAVIDMGKAFAGEAIQMGTASSEIEMRQMANRQLEILKRIEENTSTNVVVGV